MFSNCIVLRLLTKKKMFMLEYDTAEVCLYLSKYPNTTLNSHEEFQYFKIVSV